MNRVSRICSGVLILGLAAANAQTWSRDPYSRDNRARYGYGQVDRSPIGRILADLNRAARGAYLDGHERKHIDEAARNLQEFEARWARGKFDTGKLDRAIRSLEHLAEADRVRGRDRDMLARDMQDLRQFRATRGRDYQNPGYNPNWR